MTQWVNTSIASLKNIALLIRKQTDEKKEVTFFVRKESMSRPKTQQGNHWKCQRKSAMKREQPLFAEFWRLCIYLVVNMSRLQSPTRSHFHSWKRHTSQTEGSKPLIHELGNGASKFRWTWECLAVLWESTCDQTKKQAIEENVIVTKNRDVYVFHSARMSWRSGGLGSGARSVLVSLWAVEDTVTEQLMSRFYEHLVRSRSVGESLHEVMKWIGHNGFDKMSLAVCASRWQRDIWVRKRRWA